MTNKAKSTTAALALVAALGLGAGGAAHAGHDDVDIFWSIAMSQPGLHVGVSNAPRPPVVVYERPHVHAHPVYVPPPRVVYLPPHPVYRVHPGYHGRGHGHWQDRHERREERRERWEDRHERHGGYDRHERDDRHGRYDRYDRYEGERHAQGRVPNLGNGGPPRAAAPHMGR